MDKIRILWVTNIPIEWHNRMLGLEDNRINSGSWLNAAYSATQKYSNIELHIVTIGNVSDLIFEKHDEHYFYILPAGNNSVYDYKSAINNNYWRKTIELIKPNAAIIWGTERPHSYLAMKNLNGVPTAVYIQGLVSSVFEHFYDGIPPKYQHYTVSDYFHYVLGRSARSSYGKQSILEMEMLNMADGVIVENDWAWNTCRMSNIKLEYYFNKLPIKQCYFRGNWDENNIEPFSIFTNAGGYPIKGHHILFKALAIVRKHYPNFKCYIPGVSLSYYNHLSRRSGYIAYLNRLIEEGELKDNIVYTGSLTSDEMVKHLERANLYVMPSIVENHSSSLIEAMIVGTPCISSMVGGTQSLIRHGENGILYNSLDFVSLAGHIISLFEDRDIIRRFNNNTLHFREIRNTDFGDEMNKIYLQLLHVKKPRVSPSL